MKRRTWVLAGAGAAGALVVGWGFMPARSRKGSPDLMQPKADEVALNGWLKITPSNQVVLAMPRSEMGQGIHTALPMMVAEELDLPLAQVLIEQAGSDKIYGNVAMFVGGLPLHPKNDATRTTRSAQWLVGKLARELGIIVTGGSSSVADAWGPVRQAAAVARGSLLGAASLQWKLPAAELTMAGGVVRHASGKQATFAELAKLAANSPPASTTPKPQAEWKLLGTPQPRKDTPSKVFGQATFGLDVRPEGLLYASVRMAPALGGQPGRVDASRALGLPGALRLVMLPAAAGSTAGFAVVGTSTWHASRAADAVEVDWRAPPAMDASTNDTELIRQGLVHIAGQQTNHGGYEFHGEGDVHKLIDEHGSKPGVSGVALVKAAGGRMVLTSAYYAPYLAHATLEPMNCTVQVHAGGVEVWMPTQVPQVVAAIVARTVGVPLERVQVRVTQLGGGFGRRLESDVAAQAALVAMQCGGKPVQVVWPREQDTTHDFYRPAHACSLTGVVAPDGSLEGIRIHSAGDAITPRWLTRNALPLAGPVDTPDKTTSEGLFDLPYGVPHQSIAHTATRNSIPVGFWRAVGHSHNAFFRECFIDELAHASQQDPMKFRQRMLQGNARHLAVLKLVADKSGWATPAPMGHARGVAIHESFGTVVAQVVTVQRVSERLRVLQVDCALDCGAVVNPNTVAQQIESAVVFGLTAALYGLIDIQQGQVHQQNFNTYRLASMADAPVVRTHWIPSAATPTGMGEPGLPPLAPALANACFALTQKRQYRLPLVLAA